MKRTILFLLMGLFFIGFANAEGIGKICIDFDSPSPPYNLSLSGNVKEILLEWEPATDEPECSGIAKYVINRDGKKLGEVPSDVLNFTDSEELYAGVYSYTVYAIDRVGHNTGNAIKNTITIDGEAKRRVSGGGSSSSFVCYEKWNCTEWSECISNEQRRICEELNNCGTENEKPIEFRECELIENETIFLEPSTKTETQDDQNFFSLVTGAVIGVLGTPTGIIGIIFILGIVGGLVFVKFQKARGMRRKKGK